MTEILRNELSHLDTIQLKSKCLSCDYKVKEQREKCGHIINAGTFIMSQNKQMDNGIKAPSALFYFVIFPLN